MHHDNFISHAAKLNGVTNLKFEALTLLKVIILIVTHVSHYEPKLVPWICLFIVCIINFKTMVYPIIIIFEHTRCRYLLLGELFFQSFVIKHCGAEFIESLRYNAIIFSFEYNYVI